MDLELYPTVLDLVQSADNPQNLFISVFSQDDNHPDLEDIFERYNISNSYRKTTAKDARGLGFARFMTREGLDMSSYRYYLQIDSHMRFDQGWDTLLIRDYERLHRSWGTSIFSTYPPAYEFDEDGSTILIQDHTPPCVELVTSDGYLHFDPVYTKYIGEANGQETGYFCGGFSFGYTSYFDMVRPDPLIYFNGEEHLMSIRFYQKDIKIICPPYVPIYHDYDGVNRKRIWEVNPEKDHLEKQTRRRVLEFYFGQLDDPEFGIIDKEKFSAYFDNLVRDFPSENAHLTEDSQFYEEWQNIYANN